MPPCQTSPLNPQSIYLWSLKRSEGQGLRRNGNLFWRTGGRGQRTCYPPPHTREQSTPSSPVSWGERTTSAPPAQLGLLLGGQRCREGAGAATEEKRSLQIHERKLFFGAKKERPRDTFLSPQVLKSSGQLLHTFCSGGHLVAGGTGLVEQVHRTLEAWGESVRSVGLAGLQDSTGSASSLPRPPSPSAAPHPLPSASLTSGGVVGCSHELIAGEAHLWGCQVGTELLWPQLDSIVVLIDCFLGRRAGDHFSLLASALVNDAHPGELFTLFRKYFSFCFLEAFLAPTKGRISQYPPESQLTVRVFLLP